MIKFSVNRKGLEAVLGKMMSTATSLDPIKASARFLRAKLAETFDNQTDPWGNKWASLSQTTLRLRRKRGNSSTKILYDSGEMRQSLRVRDDTIEIRTPAEFHQDGSDMFVFGRTPTTLPVRRILPMYGDETDVPEPWMVEIENIITRWFDK